MCGCVGVCVCLCVCVYMVYMCVTVSCKCTCAIFGSRPALDGVPYVAMGAAYLHVHVL